MKCFGTVTNPVCIPSSQNWKGLPNAYLSLQHICALDISVPKSFRKYLKLNGGTGSSIQDPSSVCLIREIHNLARFWLSEVLSICKSVSEAEYRQKNTVFCVRRIPSGISHWPLKTSQHFWGLELEKIRSLW